MSEQKTNRAVLRTAKLPITTWPEPRRTQCGAAKPPHGNTQILTGFHRCRGTSCREKKIHPQSKAAPPLNLNHVRLYCVNVYYNYANELIIYTARCKCNERALHSRLLRRNNKSLVINPHSLPLSTVRTRVHTRVIKGGVSLSPSLSLFLLHSIHVIGKEHIAWAFVAGETWLLTRSPMPHVLTYVWTTA